jgi:hypothetical protein
MMPHFESVIGDPDGVRRIYASTWIEARQEARTYIRNRPDTAPLHAARNGRAGAEGKRAANKPLL